MEGKILVYLLSHPGARKREIAGALHVWQCNSDFLKTMSKLCNDGQICYETIHDIGNMEYYDKWYLVP